MTDHRQRIDNEDRRFIQHCVTALCVPEVQDVLRKALEPIFETHLEKYIQESYKKFDIITKRMDAFEEKLEKMNMQDTRIREIEESISDLLQDQRNTNLVVKGIKSTNDKDAREEILKIINENISVDLKERQIVEVLGFTIRKTKEKAFRVRFQNTETRVMIYKARLKWKNIAYLVQWRFTFYQREVSLWCKTIQVCRSYLQDMGILRANVHNSERGGSTKKNSYISWAAYIYNKTTPAENME